ncbi:MAG: outer membrane beta-barrel protein [Proteobacteria bacterium]|nr:outer membrane beta-barrel protein [Pseudomonadota bacterium]
MKNLKLVLLASVVFMATNVQADWQGNFLLGVSAGGAWHNNDDNFNVIVAGGTPVQSQLFTVGDVGNGDHFIWGFLGGYQARCNNWLAGLEINVDWRGDDDDVTYVIGTDSLIGPATGTISRDRDGVWGITARLGYNILPCLMPYIRLGADFTNRDFEFVGTTTDLATNVTWSVDGDGSDKWGFVGGLGLEYFMPMITGLSLRAEWNYHARSHNDDDLIATLDPAIFVTPITVSVNNGGHHHEQTARASVVYNFPI